MVVRNLKINKSNLAKSTSKFQVKKISKKLKEELNGMKWMIGCPSRREKKKCKREKNGTRRTNSRRGMMSTEKDNILNSKTLLEKNYHRNWMKRITETISMEGSKKILKEKIEMIEEIEMSKSRFKGKKKSYLEDRRKKEANKISYHGLSRSLIDLWAVVLMSQEKKDK